MCNLMQPGVLGVVNCPPEKFHLPKNFSSRDRPIMLIFLPIMLCCSAQNFDLLCSILCSCRNCSIRVCSLVS